MFFCIQNVQTIQINLTYAKWILYNWHKLAFNIPNDIASFFQGNVGDSRAVASVKGKFQQLSYDHKPSNENETKRIIAAGGWVEFNRVNGTDTPV